MKKFPLSAAALSLLFALSPLRAAENASSQANGGGPGAPVPPKTLEVAAVQMRSTADLADNAGRIAKSIRDCAARGARVAVFPECALSGYFQSVAKLDAGQIAQAEARVAAACREAGIYAIVGMPYREGGELYNSAAVISPEGRVIERYHKIQLVSADRWATPGDHLSVFRIDGVPCSIIICHDERYPELVRLPVLAGARIVFYISHESPLREEGKIGPYRAQVQARAVENTVYVVHANAPADAGGTGSHGQSRIVAPDGNIVQEASLFGEDVIAARLDLSKATRETALKSAVRDPLRDWWKAGIERVRVINEEPMHPFSKSGRTSRWPATDLRPTGTEALE